MADIRNDVRAATTIALLLGALAFVPSRVMAAPPSPAVGHWNGVILQQAAILPVTFDFSRHGSRYTGRFTCPTQRCLEYPLDAVSSTGHTVRFGLGGEMTFTGQISGDQMTGDLQNDGVKGSFSLHRARPIPYPYRVEEIRFKNGGVTLAGILCIPQSAGRHPAIIFNLGSGAQLRWGTNRFWADQFARAGVAALCYDKRGCGDSTGDWTKADFGDLAGDTIAAFHLLERRNDIDPRKIGLYGHSQGGYIAPIIASRLPRLAYIVAADSPGGVAYEQDIYRIRMSLVDQGFTDSDVTRAMDFLSQFLRVARTGKGWEELNKTAETVSGEKWFPFVAPPPKNHWLWSFYRKTGDYNSLPYWRKVHVPVLLIYGERDHSVPPKESIRAIEHALDEAGNASYTAILLPDAVHNDTIEPTGGQPFFWWHIAPGLSNLQIAWVLRQVSSAR
jgi:pimeloyl-ACP methyl ester carboxylesterase